MPLENEHRDWLTLALIPGVGTTKFIRLLARFGTPAQVLRAPESALREVAGPALAKRIRSYREVVDIEAQVRLIDAAGARLVTLEDSDYPTALAEIYDPPLCLFARGTLTEADGCAVAIVGTRSASDYGLGMANTLGRDLAARGVTVVSGLAAGIDAAAHRGAIEASGRTIAVLGCGVDVVYPAEHGELTASVIEHGAVLSPFPMGTKPSKGLFPYRNRIISGLCQGTVVVEAPPKSGALITARNAAEQGREVFAVPGSVRMRNSRGPHALIRDGAKLVESAEDILVELSAVPTAPAEIESKATDAPRRRPARPATATAAAPVDNLTHHERDVLSVLSDDGSFVDEIALACRMPVSEALSCLTLLELKGRVRQFSGKRFAPR